MAGLGVLSGARAPGARAAGDREPWPAARVRLAILMGVNLASLALAYLAVEVVGDLRVTVFQPFRMATLARGLALVAVSGRVAGSGTGATSAAGRGPRWWASGCRATGSLVVATAVDGGMAAWRMAADRRRWPRREPTRSPLVVGPASWPRPRFLARHDTESGHVPLLARLGALAAGSPGPSSDSPGRLVGSLGLAIARLGGAGVGRRSPLVVADPAPTVVGGAGRPAAGSRRSRRTTWNAWRSGAASTRRPRPSSSARPARRRSGSGRGGRWRSTGRGAPTTPRAGRLGEPLPRPRRLPGSTAEFARAYLADRHALEARYGDDRPRLADLARRQGATTSWPREPAFEASTARSNGSGSRAVTRLSGPVRPRIRFAKFSRKKFSGLPFQSNLKD